MYKPELPPTPHLVELPRKRHENRFEQFEFHLPPGSTIEDGLGAVFDRYDAPMGDRTSYHRIEGIVAADIPEIAEVLALQAHPMGYARRIALAKRLKKYQRPLEDFEAERLMEVVRKHDEEMSAAFTALEDWVASSGRDDLKEDIESSVSGSMKEWGRLSHPLLGVEVVITSGVIGSIRNLEKVVAGFYYRDQESGCSVGFTVDDIKRIPPPGGFEWAGRARLSAGGQELDFFMPNIREGAIPNVGVLHPLLPDDGSSEGLRVAVPLGLGAAKFRP